MTSFINMMASDRWTEADIVNRTEAMIAAEFPPAQVAILNRIATAAAIGQYQMTAEEQSEINRYNEVCLAARAAGDAARVDMVLLAQTLDYEAAQATIARCGPEVVALYALRNPAPVAEVEEPA
jgi:ferritin-like metal-binding protein YciE